MGGFRGTTTDPMAYHNEGYFTTQDYVTNSRHSNLRDGDPNAPLGDGGIKTATRLLPTASTIMVYQFTSMD